MSWHRQKVLLAITRCRTATLGGHPDQCSHCDITSSLASRVAIVIAPNARAMPATAGRNCSKVFVSKSGCTSIRCPRGSTTASPQFDSFCTGDFLAANSTVTTRPAEETGVRLLFQRRFFRWRSSVLELKPRLWENSLRRIPLLMNAATNS